MNQQVTRIAFVLARADDEYRGFEPFPEPPKDANSDWYFDHVDGWPWYLHMAERLLTQFHLHAILQHNP